jgi:GT2 family glycosyltransferase
VEPDFLEPLVQALNENEKMGAVQPLIYFHHDRELIWNAGTKYNKWLGIAQTIDYNKKDIGQTKKIGQSNSKIDWITGCAFMIKTEVLKKVGLLYEPFFIYYEDVDLSFRIRQLGYDLGYAPQSVIYHIAGMSHKSAKKTAEGFVSPKVHYLNARNRIWLLKKYTSILYAPTVFIYQTMYYAGVTAYFIARGRFQKIKALYKGIGEGLSMQIK